MVLLQISKHCMILYDVRIFLSGFCSYIFPDLCLIRLFLLARLKSQIDTVSKRGLHWRVRAAQCWTSMGPTVGQSLQENHGVADSMGFTSCWITQIDTIESWIHMKIFENVWTYLCRSWEIIEAIETFVHDFGCHLQWLAICYCKMETGTLCFLIFCLYLFLYVSVFYCFVFPYCLRICILMEIQGYSRIHVQAPVVCPLGITFRCVKFDIRCSCIGPKDRQKQSKTQAKQDKATNMCMASQVQPGMGNYM